MSTLQIATWAAGLGMVLGIIAAIYGLTVARRGHKSWRSGRFSDETEVVIVAPDEERRYFLRVPPGVTTEELLRKVATAIQELEIKHETDSDAG